MATKRTSTTVDLDEASGAVPSTVEASNEVEKVKKERYHVRQEHKQKMPGGQKDHLIWPGLLDLAHVTGLHSIKTTPLQLPTEENGRECIFMAEVTMDDGGVFTGVGDASPKNVGAKVVPHIIRMAETRAKGRALRDAVNVGDALLEEMSDETPWHPTATAKPQSQTFTEVSAILSDTDNPKREAVRQYIIDNYGALKSLGELTKVPEDVLAGALKNG